ncbi:BTAD domain-containing putative transcriptional regulator [Streptomyces sp. NPDC001288]|uniref:AfsR/SARP family transcriptional regulator n=1 Tax=unclassified Streptomyces TaxID=2593676 RepID=UPI00332C37ED
MSRLVTAFGELCVRDDGRGAADLGGPKPRLLLALLVSQANNVLPVDGLIDALWVGRPPRTARKNLQVYVSRLRRVLGGRLTHTPGGYLLRLDPSECDLLRFEERARTGRRHARDGETEPACGALAEALDLWQGRPLVEFGDVPYLTAAVDRLQEMHVVALEEWAELENERAGHPLVLDRLQEHVVSHPLRERLAAAWITALAATGRRSEAAAHFDTVRRALARELGVAPGPALAVLHRRLLEPSASARRPGPGNQLPRSLPDFVGRADEVQRALGYFRGRREGGVMVVSGPVGVGKSALAVHVAHLLADAFPDGLVMTELGNRSLGSVLRALLDSVGLPGTQNVAQALARWRTWVAGRRILLVLDDAVGQQTVLPLLPGSGASCTLVTSRYRLSGLDAVGRVELPALQEAEATELLGRIIGFGRVMSDRASARRIVHSCEGLPLAVRIIAAKLESLRHVRLADYADRLSGASSLLDEMAVGELVLRERYEAFWRDLPQQQRLAYRRLASLTPPFRYDQVFSEVEELHECNLLMPPAGEVSAHMASYGMSGFTHEFGRRVTGHAAVDAPPVPGP